MDRYLINKLESTTCFSNCSWASVSCWCLFTVPYDPLFTVPYDGYYNPLFTVLYDPLFTVLYGPSSIFNRSWCLKMIHCGTVLLSDFGFEVRNSGAAVVLRSLVFGSLKHIKVVQTMFSAQQEWLTW